MQTTNDKYDYYEVSVVKKSHTEVYIKVPKGTEIKFKHYKIVGQAAYHTTDSMDWDDFGWQNDVEIESIKKVSEEDATVYEIYDATDVKFS